MGVKIKYQFKNEIQVFSPFMKYQIKQCIGLNIDTNWKLVNWNKIKAQALHKQNTYICMKNFNTNRNWYYMKSKHTYIKIYEYTNNVNIDTNWKNPMIPIETTIRSNLYLIFLTSQSCSSLKWFHYKAYMSMIFHPTACRR